MGERLKDKGGFTSTARGIGEEIMFDISKAHLALAILRRLTSDRDIGLHLKGWTSIQPNKIRQLAMGKFEHLPNVKQLPCSSTLIDRTCACLQRC